MQYQGEEFEGALAGVLLYDGEGGAWDLNFSSSAHSSIRLQTWNNLLLSLLQSFRPHRDCKAVKKKELEMKPLMFQYLLLQKV